MAADIINSLSLDLPAFVIGITIHEFGHAFAADRLGDPTPREQGRVTLNPIEHLDPIGTVLPIYLSLLNSPVAFGWGKPVVFEPRNFKNPDRGYGIVALAGPLGNLLVFIFVGLFLLWSWNVAALKYAMTTPSGNFLFRLLFRVFAMNLGLFLFNLLPLPPLDGSKVLMWLGGEKVREFYEMIQPFTLLIFIIILGSNIHIRLLGPVFLWTTQIMTGRMWIYVLKPDQFIADFL